MTIAEAGVLGFRLEIEFKTVSAVAGGWAGEVTERNDKVFYIGVVGVLGDVEVKWYACIIGKSASLHLLAIGKRERYLTLACEHTPSSDTPTCYTATENAAISTVACRIACEIATVVLACQAHGIIGVGFIDLESSYGADDICSSAETSQGQDGRGEGEQHDEYFCEGGQASVGSTMKKEEVVSGVKERTNYVLMTSMGL